MKRPSYFLVVATSAIALCIATIATPAKADSPASRTAMATVSVFQGIPNLGDDDGDDGIDIYAGRTLLAERLTSGDIATTTMKPGTYSLTVLPHGSAFAPGTSLLTAPKFRVQANGNYTVALHLTPTLASTATVFENETRTVGRDMGRLTVRNIAQAPSADIRSRGSVILQDVRPGSQQDVGLRTGDYRLQIMRANSRRPLVPASNHRIVNAPGRQDMGDNRILYLWGSAADGSLELTVQEIPLDLR